GYAYVSNTFDTDVTYIVGWSMILGYPASAAFYLASFSDWFHGFIVPIAGDVWIFGLQAALPFWISGVVVLLLLVGLNMKGTEESGQFQIVVTALKVALIILFLYGGLQAFRTDLVAESVVANTGTLESYRNIGLTSALVFITFFGFEAIATNAEEIEEPGKNVPRAIFFSMGFVTVVYALVVLVVTLAVNNVQIPGSEPFLQFLANVEGLAGTAEAQQFIAERGEVAMGRAAQYFLGDVGFYVIIVGALFSMLSAANATILAGSRVKLAMSRRDHLPERFEDLHPGFGTPYWSVLLTGGLIFLFIVFFTMVFPGEAAYHVGPIEFHFGIEAIAHFADFMLLTGLIAVNFAIVSSRRNKPDLDRPFKVPGVPYVPILAVLANLVLLVNVEPSAFVLGVIAEVIGVGLWFAFIGRTEPEALERETPTVVTERGPAQRDYRIVVPIANPDNVPQLMRTADDVAASNDGEVIVMSVVTLPEQTPLSEGYERADRRREVIERAMRFAEERDIPVSGTVRIGHHAADAILNTVEQYDADAVLMGWSGTGSRRRDIVLGSTVDEVVREASADVFVERFSDDAEGDIDSILLPTAGGPHAALAAETGLAIARAEGASIEVLTVVEDGETDRRQAEALVEEVAADFEGVDVTTRVAEGDVVATILDATADHDLTIIGATQEGLLQEFVFGAIPVEVGQRADSTIIMTKRYLGITSRLRRWLRWK
ncbi:MAG TPA: amino acid permease, partial [Halobacteriales archaeon]|nr:amino acid permease [Halobacteriales archaeon]